MISSWSQYLMKVKNTVRLILAVIIASGFACKSTADKNSSEQTATVFMISGSEAHAESKDAWQPQPGEMVYFLRPEKSRTGDAYVAMEKSVASGKALDAKSRNLVRIQIVSGQPAPGDIVSTQNLSQITLTSYRGIILLCSNPNSIHIYGTEQDGLSPKTRLKVVRKYSTWDDQYNLIKGEKQVGEIEVIGKAGSNYSKAKLISGKILLLATQQCNNREQTVYFFAGRQANCGSKKKDMVCDSVSKGLLRPW